jgi:predicted Zn-dependent protease
MTPPQAASLLSVDPAFLRRKKILRIAAVVAAVAALVTAALFVRSCVVARGVRRDLRAAADLSCRDTVESHAEALRIVDALFAAHPGDEAVRARFAWQHVLAALRLGAAASHVAAARRAAPGDGAGETDPLLAASRAAVVLLEGDAEGAVAAARAVLERAPTCRECGFVYARALAEAGRPFEAIAVLDRARLGVPAFVPALAELAALLGDLGQHGPARAAVDALVKVAPDHHLGPVEGVLLEVDGAAARPAPDRARLAASLRPVLAKAVVDDAHERRAARVHYAKGRVAALAGEHAAAAAAFAVAAKLRPTDALVALHRARALRSAGRPAEALESLAAFADAPTTSPALLAARAELLLDLHRTADAAAPVAVLSAAGAAGAALLEGRRLLLAGARHDAVAPLQKALAAGHAEASLLLAEISYQTGHARDADQLLAAQKGRGVAECARGLAAYHDGRTERARAAFAAATAAGARCGASLAGRLLVGTGGQAPLAAALAAALADHDDLRDRVALARLQLRTDGQAAAREGLDRVRAAAPQGAVVLAELAAAYEEAGLADLAAEVAREGAERTGANPRLVALQARLARAAGDSDAALRFVEGGLSKTPNDPLLVVEKAAVLAATRRLQAAEELLEGVLTPGEHLASAACLKAEVQAQRGDRRESQVDLARVVARNDRAVGFAAIAPARACLARSYIQRGRASYGKAVANLALLRRQGLLWAEVSFLTGLIDDRSNKRDRAEKHYRAALDLDPAHRESWERLAKTDALGEGDLARYRELWPEKSPR